MEACPLHRVGDAAAEQAGDLGGGVNFLIIKIPGRNYVRNTTLRCLCSAIVGRGASTASKEANETILQLNFSMLTNMINIAR